MLALAIKNTIIVILIILIIHYLIKAFGKPPSAPLSIATGDISSADTPADQVHHPAFEPEREGTVLELAFPKETFEEDPPSTCDPKLGAKDNLDKPVKSECVLDQPNPNAFLLLKEYENENQMNNSQWIDNVNLYDEFGDRFSEYAGCS